jgi:hypothetical protein
MLLLLLLLLLLRLNRPHIALRRAAAESGE